MTTWYILAPIDQLCSSCQVPRRCNESDPRCLRRQALAAGNISRRKPGLREIQVLNYLEKYPDEWHRTIDIKLAIDAPYRSLHHVLRKLQNENRVATTGQGHTRKWTAKDSPSNTV